MKNINLKCDYISFTFLFNNLKHKDHKNRCEKLINLLIEQLHFNTLYTCTAVRSRFFYNNCRVFLKFGKEIGTLQYHTNNNMQNMGVFFELTGFGVQNYLNSQNMELFDLVNKLQVITNKNKIEGIWKITRYDAAADLINYKIDLNKINKKLDNNNLKFKQLSKRSNKSNKKIYIDRTNKKKRFIGENNIETLYIGSRTRKGSFLRFYNKYIEIIKNKSIEPEFQDWFRYEVEIKLETPSGINLFTQLSTITNKETFYKFNASLIINHFRLVTKKDYDVPFIKDLIKIKKDSNIGYILPNQRDSFDLEKSKKYFLEGKSGLQSLLYKIKKIEGSEAMHKYIKDILHYQEFKYEPNPNDENRILK